MYFPLHCPLGSGQGSLSDQSCQVKIFWSRGLWLLCLFYFFRVMNPEWPESCLSGRFPPGDSHSGLPASLAQSAGALACPHSFSGPQSACAIPHGKEMPKTGGVELPKGVQFPRKHIIAQFGRNCVKEMYCLKFAQGGSARRLSPSLWKSSSPVFP